MQQVSRRLKLPSFTATPTRDLIGPPCPLSNLRPVYYAPLFPDLSSSVSSPSVHPYSLSEFPRSSRFANTKQARLQALKQRLHAEDLEWRLTRYRFDAFNQDFWTRTNTHFLQAREAYIAAHPQRSNEEVDLSPFYANHLAVTKSNYADYNRTLWSLQAGLLWPAIKAAKREWKWRWEVWKAGGELENA